MSGLPQRVMRRVQHALHFCWTTTPPNESGPVPTVQMMPDDVRTFDGVPLVQQFGFAGSLPIGSQVVRLSALGDTTKGVGIGSVHGPSRPTTLTSGQSMQYDQAGSQILCSNDGNVRVLPKGGKLYVYGDLVLVGGKLVSQDSSGDAAALEVDTTALNVTGEVAAQSGGSAVHLSTHTHNKAGGSGNSGSPNGGS